MSRTKATRLQEVTRVFAKSKLKRMDQDGFQVVSRKRGRGIGSSSSGNTVSATNGAALHHVKQPLLAASEPTDATDADFDKVLRRISDCRLEVEQSEFYGCFVKSLHKGLEALDAALSDSGDKTLKTIVCYGLGNFSMCMIARYQLALLLCVRELLRLPNLYVFDPIFLNFEKELLTRLGIAMIDRNEEGKRKVDGRTLFYLPHCGRALYNNLLWANWGLGLSRVLIVGNSFARVAETVANGVLAARWPYLLRAVAHADEFGVANCFRFRDIFNDLSIHIFPPDKVGAFPDEYWDDCDEPVYDTSDMEIITNEMMKHFDRQSFRPSFPPPPLPPVNQQFATS